MLILYIFIIYDMMMTKFTTYSQCVRYHGCCINIIERSQSSKEGK